MVPDKRVPRVRVRYPIWHTRAIPCTRMAVSRVWAGILGSKQTALWQWFSDFETFVFCLAPPCLPRSLTSCQLLASCANYSSYLQAVLDSTLKSSHAITMLVTLSVSVHDLVLTYIHCIGVRYCNSSIPFCAFHSIISHHTAVSAHSLISIMFLCNISIFLATQGHHKNINMCPEHSISIP